MYELANAPRERAIAVAVGTKRNNREEALEHLDELAFLAETAGAEVVMKLYQALDKPDRTTAVGRGKLAEIKQVIEAEDIQMVIFDDDLSPAQVRNLERELEIKVLDRSGIILDIFASRAQTNEAKLQVELAQLQYLLPRLTRMWTHLSKQFGGVGTKGPGETQIESDRRLIRDKIIFLQGKLHTVAVQKAEQRKGRDTMQRFALVGYTNAGKSTLMNILSGAEVLAEDKLFATLDTTVRVVDLHYTANQGEARSSHKKILLSDTVGFIRKLPPHLVASFRSTLAETLEADILLHVVDVAHKHAREQIYAVMETLEAIGVQDKPMLMVFNKIDMLESLDTLHEFQVHYPQSVAISAFRGINIAALQQAMIEMLSNHHQVFHLYVPYHAMKELAELYQVGTVMERIDGDEGVQLTLQVNKKHEHLVQPWLVQQ